MLQVDGNRILDEDGDTVILRGVNRMGTEYECINGQEFFEGPVDEDIVSAMTTWNINAVRVPLNESCWLAVEGAPEAFSGCEYRRAIAGYVRMLRENDLIAILDLHWSGPAGLLADRLQPLPNVDHSIAFWRDVARTFKHDPGIVFEPFNEPFPNGNTDSDGAWQCWRDGCVTPASVRGGEESVGYSGAGMQHLIDAIRDVGAENLVLLGGVQYSNALSGWLESKPEDPIDNIAAAWHVYNTNPCADFDCWDEAPAELSQAVPIVATEVGEDDCSGDFIMSLLDWLDAHGAGYLAWSWHVFGPCSPYVPMQRSNPWSLITDYYDPMPNGGYAQAYYDHLERIAE